FAALGLVASFSYLARVSAQKIGTVNTILCFQIPGSLLLTSMYLMSYGYDLKVPGQVPMWRNKALIGSVYLIRTALMNAVGPLKRAILMDHVPSSERGYWSAFESLTRFGWSGSAVVGGMLMDKYGYGITFMATSL